MLPWESSFDIKVLIMIFNGKIFWVVHHSVNSVSLVCLFINDLQLGNIFDNLSLFSETNGKKQTHIWFSFYIQLRYFNLILKNHWTWTWKKSYYLTGLGLTLWYIRLGFEKYSNYLIALGLILWYLTWLEKCLHYLTGVRLILRYIGLRQT